MVASGTVLRRLVLLAPSAFFLFAFDHVYPFGSLVNGRRSSARASALGVKPG